MTGADLNLSGRWTGIFNYPDSLPPNGFEATMRDVGGVLTGLTIEQDDDPRGSGGTLHAIIEGSREGALVSFRKIYDELDPEPVIIFYSGRIQAGGDEIEGEWERSGYWSGTFLMIRASGTEAVEKRRVGETIDAR